MALIYTYRSRFLHAGAPFPVAMSQTILYRDDDGVLPECPDRSTGHAAQDSNWAPSAIPMHLWVFAYITRAALISWWRERANGGHGTTLV
ncbi:hypothetical protein [Streptacidiphilus albus]|uniref:hypothetical protein n=1 Tax=Streptacidiphilus albus TaxID=105425 RepID=UPI00054BFD1B|nr:hypothetical protein [Streptacidiphilus albus]